VLTASPRKSVVVPDGMSVHDDLVRQKLSAGTFACTPYAGFGWNRGDLALDAAKYECEAARDRKIEAGLRPDTV
jgi:hypothetical protein